MLAKNNSEPPGPCWDLAQLLWEGAVRATLTSRFQAGPPSPPISRGSAGTRPHHGAGVQGARAQTKVLDFQPSNSCELQSELRDPWLIFWS